MNQSLGERSEAERPGTEGAAGVRPAADGVASDVAAVADDAAGDEVGESEGTASAGPSNPDASARGIDLGSEPSTSLPGEHRGGFGRLPTAPVDVPPTTAGPDEHVDLLADAQWLEPEPARPHRGWAGWALGLAIVGLVVSFFVGWGFPLGLVAIVTASVGLRRPLESRVVAGWALALGILSVLYSAGWLLWTANHGGLFS
ncbi:hypothetical protein GCM10022240_15380 [Microbacterium kribbense]|uniref:DUF4190 domain-containing protein n=2 Tax=Microbacterium kribbense TaxID=433645 RepID=A0ABP7GL90_9MICO